MHWFSILAVYDISLIPALIAIKAMQALITAKPNAAYDFISETAYHHADSMLKARNK